MSELDDVWARMINEAIDKARTKGQSDVAEYLELKATNDAIRRAGVEWLLDSTIEIAAFANRNASQIQIENEHPHNFAFSNANISGSLARFRQGVRCLTVEAGWTRTPADGFMRGGALAIARLTHFGISTANAELALLRGDDFPQWFTVDKEGKRSIFDSRHLNRHFQIFLND